MAGNQQRVAHVKVLLGSFESGLDESACWREGWTELMNRQCLNSLVRFLNVDISGQLRSNGLVPPGKITYFSRHWRLGAFDGRRFACSDAAARFTDTPLCAVQYPGALPGCPVVLSRLATRQAVRPSEHVAPWRTRLVPHSGRWLGAIA